MKTNSATGRARQGGRKGERVQGERGRETETQKLAVRNSITVQLLRMKSPSGLDDFLGGCVGAGEGPGAVAHLPLMPRAFCGLVYTATNARSLV